MSLKAGEAIAGGALGWSCSCGVIMGLGFGIKVGICVFLLTLASWMVGMMTSDVMSR